MGVLHAGELVALNGKFRQPVHHREDAVMVTRRHGFEEPRPCRLGCRQGEGGSTRIVGDLSSDEIENRRVASRPDRETNSPGPGPGGEDRIRSASLVPSGGIRKPGHCISHLRNYGIPAVAASYRKCGMICSVNTFM
jgi:hypothetical protein